MGFGCIHLGAGQTLPVDYGIVSTPAEMEFEQRLLQIANDFESLIVEHQPHLVGIEKIFFAKNSKTAMRVAEARGVVLMLCAKHNVPVVEYTPAQIKKAVTGDGTADKKAMQWMVKELLGLKTIPKIDDAADALAVALTAASSR